MRKRLLFIFLFCLIFRLFSTPPELDPKYVYKQVGAILESHATYKEITPDLIKRIFENFLSEMDPHKTYLLMSEVNSWVNPTNEFLELSTKNFKKGNYENFTVLYELIHKAIDRRNGLKKSILVNPDFGNIDPSEFRDYEWVENEEALLKRLSKIHTYLTEQVAQKLDKKSKKKFLQRIEKRRLRQEKELLGRTPEEKRRIVLSLLLKAFTSALDAHSSYFTPKEARQFMIQVQSKLFGIGAQLKDDLDGLTIVRIMENGPAFKSKQLKINDRIIAVDGEPIAGMDIVESVELIRGEKDTPVKLTILRELGNDEKKHSEKQEITIKRDEVIIDEGRFEKKLEPFGDGVIAHIRLFSFYQDKDTSSSQDLKKALESIKKEHKLKGVLLDLRGNGGGMLPQAVNVAGLFIKKGIVVSIKNHEGKIRHLRNTNAQITWDGPLTILTDRFSASAAEIVAQSLQDYGRAILVGDPRTFGKGSFQLMTLDHTSEGKINPKGELKITQGKYYTVSGKSPQLDGVKTDIQIPGICSSLKVGEKHYKFPLDNDSIQPNFDDDLSDVPPIHRHQIARLYKFDLQKKVTEWEKHLLTLKKNSELRLSKNENYQKFLEELKKENFESDIVSAFGLFDIQLIEAFNVTKDLISLKEKSPS